MRLDPVDGQDPVGAGGMGVEVKRRPRSVVATTSVAIVERISAPTVSSVTPSEASIATLALCCGPAVAAHRRDDERFGAEPAQPGDGASEQRDPVGEATATGPDRDRHS